MNDDYISSFTSDREGNVTLSLAKYLDRNGWNVVACHPPGGHTSFSLLDGRRSKGGYMPDVVAIERDVKANDVPIVVIAESKPTYDKSNKDIIKLKNLSDTHVHWIAFRLQRHLNREKWLNKWRQKLQKIIAVGEIKRETAKDIPEDLIILEFYKSDEPSSQSIVGIKAPARGYFKTR